MWMLIVFVVTLPAPILHSVPVPYASEKLCVEAGKQLTAVVTGSYADDRVKVSFTCTKLE